MSQLQYRPNDYVVKVKMSERLHLLVEGRDDKHFFIVMLDELNRTTQGAYRIQIDTADMISSEPTQKDKPGNRQKVEKVSEIIADRSYSHRFLGFVDRENRYFQLGDRVEDQLSKHHIQGRLVWSRGHSIENYLFDFSTLREPLRDFSVSDYFDEALARLESTFEQTINQACAISLTLNDHQLVSRFQNAITWQNFMYDSYGLPILNLSKLGSLMTDQYHLPKKTADDLLETYTRWLAIVSDSKYEVVRWLCHGHIGLKAIWASYGRHLYEICASDGVVKPENEVRKVLKAEESVRFNACVGAWVRNSLGNQADSPLFCIKTLIDDPPALGL